MDVRGVSHILPDLDEDLLLELFYKGAKAQWTSRDLDFGSPRKLTPRQCEALARLLSPVYFGEQTAMAGASAIVPQLMWARETTAQVYIASFIMDEARHFEALTRLYRTLGYDPLGLRELPELLLYHHRLRQGDRVDWVWGILFSDIIAKHFYRMFGLAQPDPLLVGLSKRILVDESRHLAFAEHYLRRNIPRLDVARRRALIGMRDDLYRLLQAGTERVRADAGALEVDADECLGRIWTDIERYGRRIGLTGSEPPPEPPAAADPLPAVDTEASPAEPRKRTTFAISLQECFGCLLTLICGRRLTPA